MVRKKRSSNNKAALGYVNRKRKKRGRKKSLRQPLKKNNTIKIFFNLVFIVFLIYVVNKSGIIPEAFKNSHLYKKAKVAEVKKKLPSVGKINLKPKEKKQVSIAAKITQSKTESSKNKTLLQKKKNLKPVVSSSFPKSKAVTYVSKERDDLEEISANVILPVIQLKKITTKQPKLVFIIDDIGNTVNYEDDLVALGNKVVYAILPKLSYSLHFSKLSEKTKAEVMVHLPLEAVGGAFPGPGVISNDMSEKQIKKILNEDLKTVPECIGVNNHMGSSGSANRRVMNIIIKELKRKNLFIVDSHTTTRSVILDIAKQKHMPMLKRDVFIDNKNDENYILGQLQFLISEAKKKGYAIAIGHYRPVTLKLLKKEIPKLEKSGFDIISLKQLINLIK